MPLKTVRTSPPPRPRQTQTAQQTSSSIGPEHAVNGKNSNEYVQQMVLNTYNRKTQTTT